MQLHPLGTPPPNCSTTVLPNYFGLRRSFFGLSLTGLLLHSNFFFCAAVVWRAGGFDGGAGACCGTGLTAGLGALSPLESRVISNGSTRLRQREVHQKNHHQEVDNNFNYDVFHQHNLKLNSLPCFVDLFC